MKRAVPRPREIEVLANLMLGPDEGVSPLPPPRPEGLGGALEAVLTKALSHPPCVVSFSGGRDSSAVLALAADVARRHGLEPPVPAIMRFANVPASQETAWQEMVLEHIGVRDAEVLGLGEELDALGPAATGFLREHGIRWPGNAYMHLPVLELAHGGSLLTGIGGDELFSTSAPRRSLRRLAVSALPRRIRQQVWLARRPGHGYEWLTPRGSALVRRALVRDELSYPYRWDDALHHWYASRAFAALDGTIGLVARECEVALINPFLDRQVLAELASVGGARGFRTRTDAMRRVCGSLLPEAALSRPSKATFGGAAWGPRTRAFVAGWDGSGVDPASVDVARLRVELGAKEPDSRTMLLVQQAWLYAPMLSQSSS